MQKVLIKEDFPEGNLSSTPVLLGLKGLETSSQALSQTERLDQADPWCMELATALQECGHRTSHFIFIHLFIQKTMNTYSVLLGKLRTRGTENKGLNSYS